MASNYRIPADPAFTMTELRYAVAVAETLHFGRAASACHVSQPTLSTGIRKLEEQLGVRIFERSSKQVHLTQQGEIVIDRARAVLAAAQDLTDRVSGEFDPLEGSLCVGVIPTVAPYLLRWMIPALDEELPSLELVVQEGMTHQLLDAVREHNVEAILLARPFDESGLVVHPLYYEPFYLFAPANHELARRKRVSQRQLEDERVLLLTEGHCLREQALEVCRSARSRAHAPEGDFRATSLETIRQMVIAGLGVTLMPAMALTCEDEARESTVTLPFVKPQPGREIVLAYRRGSARTDGFVRLAELIRASLPDTVASR